MRMANEILPDEFADHKRRLQCDIAGLQESIGRIEGHLEHRRKTVAHVGEFLETAYDRFTRGSMANKREVAAVFGRRYTLSNRRLQVSPDPLLRPFLNIEPLKNGDLQLGKGKTSASSPVLCY